MKKGIACAAALLSLLLFSSAASVSGDAESLVSSVSSDGISTRTEGDRGDYEPLIPGLVAVNEKGTLTVGFVMVGAESDWRIACNNSIESTFSRENGYSLMVSDAQQKHEKQIKAVREFISQEVDYILLNPIVENGWDSLLEEAREAGIPVIVFDREVDAPSDAYTAWLGSDFYLEGQRACAYLEEYLKSIGYEDTLNIVHIQGTINSSAQLGRSRALEEALLEHENWKLLDQQSGEFTTAKGKEVMVDMLEKYGSDIQVVYCENDNEAYGAIEAIREAGLHPGTDLSAGDILVLSFDATYGGLTKALDREILVNTECAPLYGPLLSQLIAQIEEGKDVPARQHVAEEQFSALPDPSYVKVNDVSYPVAEVTQELIDGRLY